MSILHYDVGMRYINNGWGLSIEGDLQKVIDAAFINTPRPMPPYVCKLTQRVYELLIQMNIIEQWFCKNTEGYQIPFSRWQRREQPAVLEILGEMSFTRLNENSEPSLLGNAELRLLSLQGIFKHFRTIHYYEWPQNSEHQQIMLIRHKIRSMGLEVATKQNLLQHQLEPHYESLQKDRYD